MSIEPDHRSIEIGHIWLGPDLQRTPAATEALFLLIAHALDDLGYRRMEWKCNAANAASRAAACRLGFIHEGVFYQHRIFKGKNRDTAWFSILDHEWPPSAPTSRPGSIRRISTRMGSNVSPLVSSIAR